MRLIAFALVGLMVLPDVACAAGQTPKVAVGTPYRIARAQLIEQGFDPVPLLRGPDEIVCEYHAELCGQFPEVSTCTVSGLPVCNYLFRRRSGGRFWIVRTLGEEDHPPYLDALLVDRVWRADRYDLHSHAPPRSAVRPWTDCRAVDRKTSPRPGGGAKTEPPERTCSSPRG